MDLVAIGNEISGLLPAGHTLIVIALLSISIAFLYFSNTGRRLQEVLHESVFSNWRLALLGTTGIVLSLASGWTTWDGMRNFTQEPILSLMITFGIQGVMLIVAWLIGESFATGMNFRPVSGRNCQSSWPGMHVIEPFAGTVIGILLFSALALLIFNQAGGTGQFQQADAANTSFLLPSGLLIAAIVILLGLTLVLNAGSDIVGNYLQALRVMVRSAVLWVMFLACMATSVFFSFDSLFSTIFPKEERIRAADLRAQNQVAGVITDIGALAAQRRLQERDQLFETEGWKTYDRTLERLSETARQAPAELQYYFEQKMRDRQKIVAQRQGEKAAAESQQVRLKQRTSVLNEDIARAREAASQLSPVVEDLKSKIFAKDQEVVAKQAEAEAEAGGIGVTSRSGRGPKYREIAGQLRVLQEQKKNLQLQLREYEKRLSDARDRIARSEAELSTAQGQLATLEGRAKTADQLIQLAEKTQTKDEPAFDPTDGLRQLERARIGFRQEPTQAGLANIQRLCTTLLGAMAEVPTLKAKSAEFDCDPGTANEAAARVFALNAGLAVLAARCVGGDKLPQSGGADALFVFARGCVQDAGLPSRDTDVLRSRINYLELNRDDKAHRFVVTTNAFGDGNKLAYLALAIAIAIDTLVFMSGLFGANAVRSPLSDVPSHKGRTAKQLEAIIDTALQPHPYETARLVLGALRPITPVDGFTAEIVVEDYDAHAADLRRVLNAGSSIGAVRHVDERDRVYQVRAEFFEYLSLAAQREYEKDKNRVSIAELERTISVALLPDIETNAGIVLEHMHPIREEHGFMAEVKLDEIANGEHIRVVRTALNAGAVYQRVQRIENSSTHYFIHADFFKTLTALRGRLLMSSGAVAGGQLVAIPQAAAKPVKIGLDDNPLLTDARPHGQTEPGAGRNRDYYIDAFLGALGIEPVLFRELNGEVFSAAVSASEAFARLRQQHPLLDAYLADRDREARNAFERTNERLRLALPADNAYQHGEFEYAYRDINDNWNIVVLLPGGPYEDLLKRIVQDLEPDGGAGNLSVEDQSILQAAKRVLTAMVASQRNSISAWSRLEEELEQAADAIAGVAEPNVTLFPNIAKTNRND